MKSFAIILALAGNFAFAEAVTYKIDPGHTSIVFKADHMGFSNVYGIIGGAEGTIVHDEAKPENTKIDVTVKLDTLTTLEPKRDAHLKNPDFFDVKQFPTANLKSTSVKKKGKAFEVKGDLTLHGVTKPVSFTFTQMKTGKDPWGNTRTGGEAKFKIKRSDFGMTFMSKPGEVGNEIELIVNVEGTK